MLNRLLLFFVLFLNVKLPCASAEENISSTILQFPPNFKFGAATASYQIEGGWNASGKSISIWDQLTHEHPEWVKDNSNGDIACDSYNQPKVDVEMLRTLNVDFYRFSLSWSRLLPNGFANFRNPDGERYYNEIIDTLLLYNIEPMVTLYHWDLPKSLQDLGGWTNPQMIQYFRDYANVAFRLFGDRVKTWITFNEPIQICASGYGEGGDAPAFTYSGTADYLCGKNVLLAHARVYRLYDDYYRKQQKGVVGITINTVWYQPKSYTYSDIEAAERALQMNFGWWAHPIYHKNGDWPEVMKNRILNFSCAEKYPATRLPAFSKAELKLVRGSFDFLGLNHYSTVLVTSYEYPASFPTSRRKDVGVKTSQDPEWKGSALPWLKVVPWGLRKLLIWIKREYGNPLIYITENGFADNGETNDTDRIRYHKKYLKSLLQAIYLDSCNVRAYTVWSLMDNMEWREGYTAKFGLYQVNFNCPNRTRTAKKSAGFYTNVINTRQLQALICVPVDDGDDKDDNDDEGLFDETTIPPYYPSTVVTQPQTGNATNGTITGQDGKIVNDSAAVTVNADLTTLPKTPCMSKNSTDNFGVAPMCQDSTATYEDVNIAIINDGEGNNDAPKALNSDQESYDDIDKDPGVQQIVY